VDTEDIEFYKTKGIQYIPRIGLCDILGQSGVCTVVHEEVVGTNNKLCSGVDITLATWYN
jgi:hypothetical protein